MPGGNLASVGVILHVFRENVGPKMRQILHHSRPEIRLQVNIWREGGGDLKQEQTHVPNRTVQEEHEC